MFLRFCGGAYTIHVVFCTFLFDSSFSLQYISAVTKLAVCRTRLLSAKKKGNSPSLPSAFAILTTPAFADRELAFPRFSNVETADASLEPIHAFFLSQICPRQGPNLGCGGYNAPS
jgi:hypothetical protein